MFETLKQIEATLILFKKELATYEKYYSSAESEEGNTITQKEKEDIDSAKEQINRIEKEISTRKEKLENADIMGVFLEYDTLLDKINSLYNETDETYKLWQHHIYTVGTAYAKAYDSFKKTVEAKNKHAADLANILGSLITIAGVGTLSWISTTGALANTLAKGSPKLEKIAKDIANIAEDITQVSLDKAVSYAASKMATVSPIDMSGPLIYQNEISQKALKECLGVLKELRTQEGIVISCKETIKEFRKTLKSEDTKGSDKAKAQYEKFMAIELEVKKMMNDVSKWIKTHPKKIDVEELQKDLERCLWAEWLPSLKSYQTTYTEGMGEFIQFEKEVIDNTFGGTLSDRLTELIDLKSIGVEESIFDGAGDGGLDFYVTEEEVKKLIGWAKKFKPTHTF